MPDHDETLRTVRHENANPNSVELTLTSAGKIGGTVKVYDADENAALGRASAVLDRIRTRYPQG